MNKCTCLAPDTDTDTDTCGWCGILPEPAPIGAAPESLADRLAPVLADVALFTRLANDETVPAAGRYGAAYLARRAHDSARYTAQLWARGA